MMVWRVRIGGVRARLGTQGWIRGEVSLFVMWFRVLYLSWLAEGVLTWVQGDIVITIDLTKNFGL
jgi:hypothetical protein